MLDDHAQDEIDRIAAELGQMRMRFDGRLLAITLLHYAAEIISDVLLLKLLSRPTLEQELDAAKVTALRDRTGEKPPKLAYYEGTPDKVRKLQ